MYGVPETKSDRLEWLEALLPLARQAGDVILEIYAKDFAVRGKVDASPVTEADERAEELILAGLAGWTPDIPAVSEEAAAGDILPAHVAGAGRFWLVDPLDGTKEFIRRNGEFTVNIALVAENRPVLGVVLAPALGRLFAGGPGLGAFIEEGGVRSPLACRRPPREGLTVVGSRSHGDGAAMDALLAGRRVAAVTAVGSSLKFCLLAAGEADFYPRLGPTMEWDTAAGHAVLLGAGGRMKTLEGGEFWYGKPNFRNAGFLASGRA